MRQGLDWMHDSFACRPPQGTRRQIAALHWVSRLRDFDPGPIPKLTPLSYRGPMGCSIIALSRLRSHLTSIISDMRQGNASMQRFPFVQTKNGSRGVNHEQSWTTCLLCTEDSSGPRYDLWHVLFKCPKTRDTVEFTRVRTSCEAFVPLLCNAIEAAAERNAESLSDTRNAGVSHENICSAANAVREAIDGYDWNCDPGRWLIYTLLLALPFPKMVVRPDPVSPIWLCPQKRRRKGVVPDRNLRGMPESIPQLPDAQYKLPEAMGQLYDCTILSSNSLRPLADMWCSMAKDNLLRAGTVVRRLRTAADKRLITAASNINARAGANDDDVFYFSDIDATSTVSSVSCDGPSPSSDPEPCQ